MWGVAGFETSEVHVVVRRGARVIEVADVPIVVHESRRFGADDVRTARAPAVTRLSRSVVDAATWTPDVEAACRIIVAPVQQRRQTADATFRRGDGRLVRDEIDGGVHLSLLARWRDTSKDNDAVIDGRPILRFPSVAVYIDDAVAVRQLRRALGLVSV